jgi:excisionase family DNA binding protein
MFNNVVDEVMTLKDLAGYLKIPVSTIYKFVREGKIPAQKVGRQWRFSKSAIDHWLGKIKED